MENNYLNALDLINMLNKKGIKRFDRIERCDLVEWNAPYTFYSLSEDRLLKTEVSLIFDKLDEVFYFYINDSEYDPETACRIINEIVNEEMRKLNVA